MGNYACCSKRDDQNSTSNQIISFMGVSVLGDSVPHVSTYLSTVTLTQKVLWSFGGVIDIYLTSDNKTICSLLLSQFASDSYSFTR